MSGLRQYIAVLLLLVFSLGIFPKETLHLLSGHQDTQCFRTDRNVLEATHHHCQVLSLALPAFTGSVVSMLSAYINCTSCPYAEEQVQYALVTAIIALSLRGPPQA